MSPRVQSQVMPVRRVIKAAAPTTGTLKLQPEFRFGVSHFLGLVPGVGSLKTFCLRILHPLVGLVLVVNKWFALFWPTHSRSETQWNPLGSSFLQAFPTSGEWGPFT